MNLSYTSREQVDVYRFSWPVAIGIPILAVVIQAWVPTRFTFVKVFDFPLLVTIFFAVSRRNPASGSLLGAAIGLTQDALTHLKVGMFGIANTVIGYVASSLGVKIDVDNPGSRFIMTFVFYVLHQLIYFSVAHGLINDTTAWNWGHEVGAALANSLMAVVLFAVLDRFKIRT